MFRAGCAGDLKGGTLGNPVKALALEGVGAPLGWLGLAFAIMAALCRPNVAIGRRGAIAVTVLVLGGAGVVLLGVQFEIWGTQSCFVEDRHG
ncbi:MAG: hypothetical protein JF607_23020 [Burkholderiales bacterium]|nr:hypothetical protein [Burkholderiales bacterium]